VTENVSFTSGVFQRLIDARLWKDFVDTQEKGNNTVDLKEVVSGFSSLAPLFL